MNTPLKITWKWFETANNYFYTLEEYINKHELSKSLTKVFIFKT